MYNNDVFLSSNHLFFLTQNFYKTALGRQFLDFFERTIISEQPQLLIACSGGSDSMFLTHILLSYRHIVKGQSLSTCKILHYNHGTSSRDNHAESFVSRYFGKSVQVVVKRNTKKNLSETVLRKNRQKFYEETIFFYSTIHYVYLCLGHHLQDRIENAYLHLHRGSGLSGIVNMVSCQKKYLFSSTGYKDYEVIRPLLHISKREIQTYCHYLSIPYSEDPHNTDSHATRTRWRKNLEHLTCPSSLDLFRTVFATTEKLVNKHTLLLTPIQIPLALKSYGRLYGRKTPISYSIEWLIRLLYTCNLYSGATTKKIDNLFTRLDKSKKPLFLGGFFFEKQGEQIYIVYTKNKQSDNIPYDFSILPIDHNGVYAMGGFQRKIKEEQQRGLKIRYPRQGDRFAHKSRGKWCNENKIPTFRRKHLPILEKNGIILKVLPREQRCR